MMLGRREEMGPLEKMLLMDRHVCPWWLAYTFDNPLRRLIHNPEKMLAGLIERGDTVLDVGCGMGYFSIGMAKLVGEEGLVISADIQKQMLERVGRRAGRLGLLNRIRLHLSEPSGIGLTEKVDFALAFWMVHEVPDTEGFLHEIGKLLTPESRFLLAEPKLHVSAPRFQEMVDVAGNAGLRIVSRMKVRWSHAVLLALR
jgi:ubiquinone/menaquinone biosynthesis C-methylase UbiE